MPVKFTRDLLDSCTGEPPKGCRFCDRGTKMVLYITGICARDCFYCPLSEEKKDKDVTFANERRVEGETWLDQIVDEARRMKSLGTGITGGDPMLVIERTVKVIKRLKEEFGGRYHVHLYTSGPFEKMNLSMVKSAGLDEIRFHPPLDTWEHFEHLGRDRTPGDPQDAALYHDLVLEARRLRLSVGLEVPAVVDPPEEGDRFSRGLYHLLRYAAREGLDFVNINELEASHTNMEVFGRMSYDLVGDSMAVKGSMELAFRTIGKVRQEFPDSGTVFHICSSVYKDSVQLRNRLVRMARNLARPFEVCTDDGTLLRGVIVTEGPEALMHRLSQEYEVPVGLMMIEGGRLLIAPWVLEEIGPELDEECYISEAYPTWDKLEVERVPVKGV